MKTILFSLLAFVTLAVAAPVAQAGQYARVYTNRGPVYLHKSQLYSPYRNSNYYGSNYYGSNYRHHHRRHYRSYSNYYRPSYRSYYRPSYYGGYYPSYGYSSCYSSRPRVAISFGF
jgi:hypothetical protein